MEKIDKLFQNNSAADSLVKEQLDEANNLIVRVGLELTSSASKQLPLFERIAAYGSLPISDRYTLIPAFTLCQKYRATLRILLDDLAMLEEMTANDLLHKNILETKAICVNLLSSITEMCIYLESIINQQEIPETVSIHF